MTSNSQLTKTVSVETTRQTPAAGGAVWGILPVLLVVVGLAGIAWIAWPAGDADSEELADRRERIEKMSAIERDRLERNYERFQKLSPEEQAALSELQESVEWNSGLKSTFVGYERWLKTLSPWERLELRNAENREQKIQVVQSINAERKRQQEEIERQEEYYAELVKRNLPPNRDHNWRLSDEGLFELVGVLDEKYGKRVKLPKNALPGKASYHMRLLALALRENLETREEEARDDPLPEGTVQAMVDTIDNPDVRKFYGSLKPRDFVKHLTWKLQLAWGNDARRHHPKQAELDRLARVLGGKELTRFEELKETDPREAYFPLLKAVRSATYRQDTKPLDDVLDELGIRQSRWRPSWGGNRFNGGRFGSRSGDRNHGSKGRDQNKSPDNREKTPSNETPNPARAAKNDDLPESQDDSEM